ncbi:MULTISPECIES: hypothetical protein [Sphingobacterium]|uniref:hypothetical protein n=1 Tax=Sphingobacterium TaxID=28453 RepID=UPI0013DD1CEA|nr:MULTISPECIES: hypothetical protein [unclassified Sphingobacterium]
MFYTQKELFERIAIHYKSKNALCKTIATAMSASEKTVEKWISADTVLNYDRLYDIVNYLKLTPIDIFKDNQGWVYFKFMPLDMNDLDKYYSYISTLALMFRRLADNREGKIFFMADEIPIFHFMPFKNLTYFKLYQYYCDMQKTEDSHEDNVSLKYEDFAAELDKLDLAPQFEAIHGAYEQITSREIWDDTILDSLLYGLYELRSLHRFREPKVIQSILAELKELIEKFRIKGNRGKKSAGVRIDVFKKRTPVRQGFMVWNCPGQEFLSMKLDTINSMLTFDSEMIRMFKSKFKADMDRSKAFGMGDVGERISFYDGLIEKIENTMEELG